VYFRSGFQGQEEPYRIPENYSGNAFPERSAEPEFPMVSPDTEKLPTPELPPETPPDVPSEKTPHGKEVEPRKDVAPEKEVPPGKETPLPAVPTFLSSLLPPKPRGLHGGFLSDIGTEELLILGLILLLSQNDSDDDIVLLLLLLLFYK
jgi:hypothetical protein